MIFMNFICAFYIHNIWIFVFLLVYNLPEVFRVSNIKNKKWTSLIVCLSYCFFSTTMYIHISFFLCCTDSSNRKDINCLIYFILLVILMHTRAQNKFAVTKENIIRWILRCLGVFLYCKVIDACHWKPGVQRGCKWEKTLIKKIGEDVEIRNKERRHVLDVLNGNNDPALAVFFEWSLCAAMSHRIFLSIEFQYHKIRFTGVGDTHAFFTLSFPFVFRSRWEYPHGKCSGIVRMNTVYASVLTEMQ